MIKELFLPKPEPQVGKEANKTINSGAFNLIKSRYYPRCLEGITVMERLGNRCKCRQQLNAAAALATATTAHDTLAQTVIHIHATTGGRHGHGTTYVPWCARVRIRCVHLSSLPPLLPLVRVRFVVLAGGEEVRLA